jgi:hypothetical protein
LPVIEEVSFNNTLKSTQKSCIRKAEGGELVQKDVGEKLAFRKTVLNQMHLNY